MANAFNPNVSSVYGTFLLAWTADTAGASTTALEEARVIPIGKPTCSIPVLSRSTNSVIATFGADVGTVKFVQAVLIDAAAAPALLADSTVTNTTANVIVCATGVTIADKDVVQMTIVVGG
jgi:hypothetical protein